MHRSETWPKKVEHELKMNRIEMSMIRWMCGVKVNERKKSEELRELLGLEALGRRIKGGPANPGSPGKMAVKTECK